MFTIETSASQKAVHVDDFGSVLKNNQRAVLLSKATDWIIVDAAKTWEEALAKAAFWEGVMGGAEHER